MNDPKARRDGDEFVVEHEDGTEQRLDMTSVMHKVDVLAYQKYLAGQAKPDAGEVSQLEAAVELAKEQRENR